MKPKENNLEKNISRLVKLAGDSSKPGKAFSDSLTNDALSELKQPIWVRIASFRKPAWIGAAAAVLVIGLLLMVPQFTKDKSDKDKIAKFAKDMDETAAGMKLEGEAEIPPVAKGPEKIAAMLVDEEAIPQRPPFAPASAIELVTLPRREKVQLTIYNSADLTLVRERRNLTLKKGWNWLQFMWANTLIDPTSLSLEPLAQADKIDIQQLVFPARLKDIGRWLIRSETEGQVPFEVTYFTSGLSWRAFYMGTLSTDEQKMKLGGYVRITNKSGEDYENAQTRLIVGKVHQLDKIAELARRRYPYNSPQDRRDIKNDKSVSSVEKYFYEADSVAVGNKLERMGIKEIKKEGLSEYFLYTIEGTETIADGWGKRLVSFEAEDIAVKSLYKYDRQRWGTETVRYIAFANDKKHNLGETPIPNGNVQIYSQADEQGYLSYIGGMSVKYIPVNEEVELNLGSARLVSVEPVLMNFKTDNYVFDNKNNVAGWDEIRSWKVEVTNTRNLPVEVEITRGFGTAYWTLQMNDGQDVPYEKHDATHARFKAKVKPRSKRTFTYTVTTYHGRREEQANQ
ncbi:MAG TPA: DUF4139 domain-containing protein [Phycisphaerales bacterium]|nr:DUF4139 domain-containing protein [Phycisphaerales bacterium]